MHAQPNSEQAPPALTSAAEKRSYRAPELTAHGELTVLTQGFGAPGEADFGFYVSSPT
jgi:hypothetical protein